MNLFAWFKRRERSRNKQKESAGALIPSPDVSDLTTQNSEQRRAPEFPFASSKHVPVAPFNTSPLSKKPLQMSAYAGWIYAAATIIAQDEAAAQYKFWKRISSKRSAWEEVALDGISSRLRSILARPNAQQVWWTFTYMRSLHKSLTGEAYWHFITQGSDQVYGLELIMPHWVKGPKFKVDRLVGWQVQRPGKPLKTIPADEIVFDPLPHPADAYRGMSPVQAFAMSYDLDLYSKAYGSSLVKNRAVPDIILTTDAELDEVQKSIIENRWVDKYQGKGGGVAVLHSGAKAQQLGFNLSDLVFIELAQLTKEEIMQGAFGVPMTKRGGNTANVSLAEMQERNYQLNTLVPRFTLTDSIMNYQILPRLERGFPYWFEHVSPVSSDADREQKKADAALKRGAITVNQYLTHLNLPNQGAQGNVYLLPKNVRVVKKLGDAVAPPSNGKR